MHDVKHWIQDYVSCLPDLDYSRSGLNFHCDSEDIPNIFHFVYTTPKDRLDFNLFEHIAIKSCVRVNKPEKIMFHYVNEPTGEWWEKSKTYLTLNKVELPTHCFDKKISFPAHACDMLRMQALISEGGVYADLDTIFINKIPKKLFKENLVMGEEDECAICNALVMCKKNSKFAIRWFKDFETEFHEDQWANHSVHHPRRLSYQLPNQIKIVDRECFYGYHYTQANKLYGERVPDWLKLENIKFLSLHLWHSSLDSEYLESVTEDMIISDPHRNIFNFLAYPHIVN
jgi:hypothetical protein